MSNGNTYIESEEARKRREYKEKMLELYNQQMQADYVTDEDESSMMMDFAGNLSWGALSSASWGALDVAALTETGKKGRSALALGTYKPWEEQTGAGKVGYIAGQGLGMLATFSWTAKGLGLLSKLLTRTATNKTGTYIARKAGTEAVEKFGEKRGIELLTKYGDKLAAGEVDDLALEGLERGTLAAMREATKIVRSPGYKRLWKHSQEAYTSAVDDLSRKLLGEMPDMGLESAMKLSDDLISSSMKYSTHQFHNYMDGLIGRAAAWTAKGPGVAGRAAEWTLTGKTGQLISAMASDAALGFTHHLAQAAVENITYKTGEILGGEFDQKELKHFENLNSGFMETLKHSGKSGLWMSLIAPTRFLKGGRAGSKLHKEALSGLNTLRKAWKPANRMAGEQARTTLQLIDDVSGGALKSNVLSKELLGKKIGDLTKEEAIPMLQKVRKDFSREWLGYMGTEIRKDLWGASPRMIAGALAMNLPAIKQYYDDTGKFSIVGAFGADPTEIVSNMIVGMVFAKSGRTFGEGSTSAKQSRFIETGELKQYYTANIKKIKAVRHGLEMMGYKSRGNGLDINPAVVEYRGRSLINSGDYKIVDDILRDKFVVAEDSAVIEGAKPLNEAYESVIDVTGDPVQSAKLRIAMQVIAHYDNNATDIGRVMRHVTPGEALEIVGRINDIPGIKEHKTNPEVWLRQVELQSGNTANERFIDLQMRAMTDFYESIGIDTSGKYDPTTGILRLPKIDIEKLLGSRPSPELQSLKATHAKFIEEGMANGWLIVEGPPPREMKTLSNTELKSVEKGYKQFVGLMNDNTYGRDTMMHDRNILHDNNMWIAYNVTKTDMDTNNVLFMNSSASTRKKLFTSLSETDVELLDRQLSSLQLNEGVIAEFGPGELDTKIDAARVTELSQFHSRVQNVHNILTGNKNMNKPTNKTVTLETISIAREHIRNKLGDIFDHDAAYERLLSQSVDHMVNTLDIQSIHRDQQLKFSLLVMMNGGVAPSGTSIGDLSRYGGLVIRREGTIEIPDSKALFDILKASPDLQEVNLDKLMDYYSDFQSGISAASGKFNITNDVNNIARLVKDAGGAVNVRNILSTARLFSHIGHVSDLHNGYINLEAFMNKIGSDNDKYIKDYGEMRDFDTRLSGSLKDLIENMGTLRANIKHLIDTRDYDALINMKLQETSSLMESLERFQKRDLMDVIDRDKGNIVDELYRQELVNVIAKAKEMLGAKVLGYENISAYVDEQIKKSTYDIYTREHVLRINTTPQKFESDYGVRTSDQESIIDKALGGKTANDIVGNLPIIRAVTDLVNARDKEPPDIVQRGGIEQIYNDAWQLVSAKAFSDDVKRVKYVGGFDGGMFISDKVGLPVQRAGDGRGLTGLKNILFGNGEGWYELQKDVKFLMEGEEVARDLRTFDDSIMSTIDGQIEAGIGIESKTVRNEYLKQTLKENLIAEISPDSVPMIRVILNDQTQIVVSKDLAERSVKAAYAEGGILSELVGAIYGADTRAARDFLQRFRTPDMTVDLLKDGINEAWNILNQPSLLIDGGRTGLERVQELDYMKRRKLADISSGKILNDRYHNALTEFYDLVAAETGSSLAVRLADSYRGMRDENGVLRPMRSISIDDSGEVLSVIDRFRKRLDTYDEDIMMGVDRDKMEQFIESISKEATDSPTFLSKSAFLRFLGTFAPSRELIQLNEAGEIVGFNVGSMKPKGVDIQIREDGSLKVSYDKTAFFYDPKIGEALDDAKLDEVKFKSGNKINVSRVPGGNLEPNYVEPITRRGEVDAASIEEIMLWTIDSARDGTGVTEAPWEAYNLTQVSVPHTGTVGSNTGVHYSNKSGLHDWTQIGDHVSEFGNLMGKLQDSPEALTGIGRSLSDMARTEGDLNPARTALDSFLDSQGVVVSDWMGDLVVDNLFSRYFQGSKIASREVKGSSYSPMAPFLADKNVDLPVLYEGEDNIGRQRIYGGFGINSDIAQMPFKALGRSTHNEFPVNGDKNKNVTGFFIARHSFFNPVISKNSKSEFVIIPNEKKGFTVIVEGMELKKDGTFIDIIKGKLPKLLAEQKKGNKEVYEAIENDIKELRTFWETEGATNEKMLDRLASLVDETGALRDNMWMGVMNTRQPRNAFDVIVNKVHRENIGTEENPIWNHYDEREGNSTRQNSVDVLRQDADHDFDKSNVYSTAPPDFIKEVATMAGARIINDPVEYSESLIKKVQLDMGDQAGMRDWFKDVNNTSALRGRFVKLHQISTYLMNALDEGGVLGKMIINNKQVLIKMKSRREYIDVVGNISKTVKYFLDNYRDIIDVRTEKGFSPGIDNFIRDILFGKEKIVNGEPITQFEGLFEFVGEGVNQKRLDGKVGGDLVAETLYREIVSPLNKYLTYNRGELTDADIKSKMTLKDVFTGWSGVKNAYWTGRTQRDKILDIEGYKIDLTTGKNRLYKFITNESNNPFEISMRSLSSSYDAALQVKRHGASRETAIETLIFQGESQSLPQDPTNIRSVSDKIFKMVKDEGTLAQLAMVSDRLSSLEGELARLKASQYSNPYDIEKAANSVEYYTNLKIELELLAGSKISAQRLENVFRFSQGRAEGKQTAYGEDWVVWDSRGKNIQQVIREGETNQKAISPSDIIVRGGKKFDLSPAKRQDRLREKWVAYGKPLLEMVSGGGKVVSMNKLQYDGSVIPAYLNFTGQYGKVGREWGVHRDGVQLANDRKTLLHLFLNDIGNRYGLNDPLKRRSFIFKLMTPEIDQNTYVVRQSNGKFAYDYKFTENEKISKTIYSYLTDVRERQSFSKDNVMTSEEANNIILELSRKHALVYYGLTDPYTNVDIASTRTASYLSNMSKRLVDIDKNILRPDNLVKGKEHEFNNAMSMINQFINGDRLITPFDMARISRKIIGARGGANMFTIGESSNSNPILVRKHGKKGTELKKTIDQLFSEKKERERRCRQPGL